MPISRKIRIAAGFGDEVAWGTAVARTKWLNILSCSLQERPRETAVDTLYQSNQPDLDDGFEARVDCDGDLELPILYEGFGIILKHVMGAAASTTGAGPYVHTTHRGDSWGTAFGLTAEILRGSQDISEIFAGLVFPRAEFIFERDKMAIARLSCLAKKATGARADGGDPTFGGTVKSRMVRLSDLSSGSITFNAVAYVVKRLSIVIDNKLASTEEAGSQYITEPARMGQGEVLVRATLIHRVDTLYAAHRARTMSDLTFTFDNGDDSIAVTARNCRILEYGDPLGAGPGGLVEIDVTFRAHADSTNGALSFVITNDQATALTN